MTEQKTPAGMANTADVIARAQARRDSAMQPATPFAVLDREDEVTDDDPAEVARLRKGLWDCYSLAGGDTEGLDRDAADPVELAAYRVRDLRTSYSDAINAQVGRSSSGVPGPVVVTLCGSTKFKDAFLKATLDLTLAGEIVLTVGGFRGDVGAGTSEEVWGVEAKEALDRLHKWKIEKSARVLVLNVGGYVGASTRSEIAFAVVRGKRVDFLEPDSGEAILESVGADHDLVRAVMRDVDEMGLMGPRTSHPCDTTNPVWEGCEDPAQQPAPKPKRVRNRSKAKG